MSVDDRFRRKLAAFLHDPIDKPLVLMQTGERHEERARRLRNQLGLADLRAADPASDHVASAMERAFVPEQRAGGRPVMSDFRDAPEIRHPFSGRPLENVDALSEVDLAEAMDGVEAAAEAFDLSADAPREAFLTLWRAFLPALREHGPEALAPFWSVLPADTRIPDHGVFQHLTVTSAFSGLTRRGEALYTNATFLLVTIGPAQAFIQQARKTQDLYWGSALLSRLAWAAMTPVVEAHGPDAVFFPNLHGQPLVDAWLQEQGIDLGGEGRAEDTGVPTLPNRFFAVVETSDQEARAALLQEIEDAVYDQLDALADRVFESDVVPGAREADLPRAATRAHLRDALSVYGVALPFQPGDEPLTAEGVVEASASYLDAETLDAARELLAVAEDTRTRYDASPGHVYSLLHTLSEKLLRAQKNTRSIRPLPANESDAERGHGERGRKCSLCGERNVLFYRGTPAQIHHNEQAVSVGEAPGLDAAQMRDGEGLCGMCFVKRFVGRTPLLDGTGEGFPSTTEVALAPLRDRHEGDIRRIETALKKEIGAHDGTFDDQLFFEENLRPGYLAKYVFPHADVEEDQDWLAERTNDLRAVWEDTMPEGLPGQMTKYYGLLVLDGDNMGEWVAGKEAPRFEGIYHSQVWAQLPGALKDALRDLPSPGGRGQRPLTPALHAALSRALTDYALEAVRPIVESEYHGTLVYAGGDDVLAFVPLPEALDVALHLRAAFSGHRPLPAPNGAAPTGRQEIDFEAEVSGFRQRGNRIVTTLGPEASASVGMALAHYKTPLGEVLGAARGMEERAKEAGRDHLAVALLKRSGERTEGLLPFRHVSVREARGPVGIFQDLIAGLSAPGLDLSPNFIRTLQQELRPLLTGEGTLGGDFSSAEADDLLESELARLLRRSLDAEAPKRADAFVEEMSTRLSAACTAAPSIGVFLDMLDVALFLHRKTTRSDVRRAYAA